MATVFEGIKVVEVAQFAAGPMAGRWLADFGADVIHIEHPVKGDLGRQVQSQWVIQDGVKPCEVNFIWDLFSSNKKSVTLDLSKEDARKILYKLVEKADVFLTNSRLPELKKLGYEYETLSRINPRLIYAYLNGYGTKGPDAELPGFDGPSYFCRTGITHMLHQPGADIPPPKGRPNQGDCISAMALAFGITMALFARERTGVGQQVETSLFNMGLYSICFDLTETLFLNREPKKFPREEKPQPVANFYQTKDGRWLFLGIVTPEAYWERLCKALGREDLIPDLRFGTLERMVKNKVALIKILDEAFVTRTLDEWRPRLAEVPWSPVANLMEVIADPQVAANDCFPTYQHPQHGPIKMVGLPIKFSKTPGSIRNTGPEFSQHTEEVLMETGYTWEDIERFKQQGLIA